VGGNSLVKMQFELKWLGIEPNEEPSGNGSRKGILLAVE
jgi:hypothetical protein